MSDLEPLMADVPRQAARLRLVAVHLQLDVVVDDGTDLSPVQTPPISVPATAWPPDLDAIMVELQANLDAQR